MQYTNHAGLPQPLVDAVQAYEKPPGSGDISVTQLIDSPQVSALRAQHEAELVEDVSDLIWALMGKAIHTILERADQGSTIEAPMRISWPVPPGAVHPNGRKHFIITGQLDRLAVDDGDVLQDWKMMSVWEHIFGLKVNREQQLNLYRFIWNAGAAVRGLPRIERLQAIGLFRDWSIGEYERKKRDAQAKGWPFDYPPQQVHVYDLPVWDETETVAFINEQLVRHFPADGHRQCSSDDMWYQPGKVAVMKEGRKTAMRVLDTEDAALVWCSEQGLLINGQLAAGVSLDTRAGQYNRCRKRGNGRSYCPVASFCPQWAAIQEVHNLGDDGQVRS